MTGLTSSVTVLLSWLAILAQVFAVALLAIIVFSGKFKALKKIRGFLHERAIHICLLVSLVAVLGSLFYSEIAGFAPCSLCWAQRIFIFPQLILFLIAFVQNKRDVFKYALGMAVPGALVSTYHQYIQMGGINFLSCGAGEGAASCSQLFVIEFGYVTLPFMAFITSLIIGLMAYVGMGKTRD